MECPQSELCIPHSCRVHRAYHEFYKKSHFKRVKSELTGIANDGSYHNFTDDYSALESIFGFFLASEP